MDIALIGLIFIMLGWVVQLAFSSKEKKDVNKWFLALYAIGAFALVWDAYKKSLSNIALFNLITLILCLTVLIKTNCSSIHKVKQNEKTSKSKIKGAKK
jgi:uncharacterized membrane protein